MPAAAEFASLFRRDLTRLIQELDAFPEDQLWATRPGIANSAGNLFLHLEGNMREYIGRQLGRVAYQRQRPLEFSSTGLTGAELRQRLEGLPDLIHGIVASLSAEALAAEHPEHSPDHPATTRQFLMHLFGHLNYHVGQIDYLRRVLTGSGAIPFAQL